jgi:hypothetical protein
MFIGITFLVTSINVTYTKGWFKFWVNIMEGYTLYLEKNFLVYSHCTPYTVTQLFYLNNFLSEIGDGWYHSMWSKYVPVRWKSSRTVSKKLIVVKNWVIPHLHNKFRFHCLLEGPFLNTLISLRMVQPLCGRFFHYCTLNTAGRKSVYLSGVVFNQLFTSLLLLLLTNQCVIF